MNRQREGLLQNFLVKTAHQLRETNTFNNYFTKSFFQNFLNNLVLNSESGPGRLTFSEGNYDCHVYFSNEHNPQKNSFRIEKQTSILDYDTPINLTPEELIQLQGTYSLVLHLTLRVYLQDKQTGEIIHIQTDECRIGEFPAIIGNCFDEYSENYNMFGSFIYKGVNRILLAVSLLKRARILKKNDDSAFFLTYVNSKLKYFELLERVDGLKIKIQKYEIPFFIVLKYFGLTEQQIFTRFTELGFSEEAYLKFLQDSVYTLGEKTPEEYFIDLFSGRENFLYVIENNFTFLGEYNKPEYISLFLLASFEDFYTQKGHSNYDDFINKEVFTGIDAFIETFEANIRKMLYAFEKRFLKRSIRKLASSPIKNIGSFFESNSFEGGFNKFFMLGVVQNKVVIMSQIAESTNEIGYHSNLTKVLQNVEEDRIDDNIRRISPSSFGRLCILETPDSKSIGLRKNLSVFGVVSSAMDFETSLNILSKFVTPENSGDDKMAFLNKIYIGYLSPKLIPKIMKAVRKADTLNFSWNMGFDVKNAIHIDISPGRVLTPYLSKKAIQIYNQSFENVDKNDSAASFAAFTRFIKNGGIYFLDCQTERNFKISQDLFKPVLNCQACSVPISQKYQDFFFGDSLETVSCPQCGHSHPLEIVPKFDFYELSCYKSLGLAASLLPFVGHNPSSRMLYGISTSKQALAERPLTQTDHKFGKGYGSTYVENPLVYSAISALNEKYQRLTRTGINLITYYGTFRNTLYDGLVLSKAAVERGLYRGFTYEGYNQELEMFGFDLEEKFGSNYEFPNLVEGIPKVNSKFGANQVLISKLSPQDPQSSQKFGVLKERQEVVTTSFENEVVDKVLIYRRISENKVLKVRTRNYIPLIVGDKLSSRNGQKAITSTLLPEYELPVSVHGVSPDIIVDVLSIGSRMTSSSIIEGKVGMEAIENNQRVSVLPFVKNQFSAYHSLESHQLRNPVTGDVISGAGNLDITYFMRLHHVGSQKAFMRNEGKVQVLTRQPTEGRGKEGGLRLGEMERDCLLSYGATHLLKDKYHSDLETITVRYCPDCKRFLPSTFKNSKKCMVCSKKSVFELDINYSVKLLVAELLSLGIELTFDIDPETYQITKIHYGVLSNETVLKLAEVEVFSSQIYSSDGFPIPNGVLDPKFGPSTPKEKCVVCMKDYFKCSGHWGYISLEHPVCNFLFSKKILKLLNSVCHGCGHVSEGTCNNCGDIQSKVVLDETVFNYVVKIGDSNQILEPFEILQIFEKIPVSHYPQLSLKEDSPPQNLIIKNALIPPINIRPSLSIGKGENTPDDLTAFLSAIVSVNNKLVNLASFGFSDLSMEKYLSFVKYLFAVYQDNTKSLPRYNHLSGKPLVSLVERIKGKKGRIRANLSGKRTDNSARAVVSVNADLPLDTVEIPELFHDLTVQEKVCNNNLEEVIQGILELRYSKITLAGQKNRMFIFEKNKEIIAQKVTVGSTVVRKIQDGDIVLFNRQPSLHKHSILALKVKLGKGCTLRFHPALCHVFNADFDGDEMNVFVPQSEAAKLEAKYLLGVRYNFLSPKNKKVNFTGVLDVLLNLYLASGHIFQTSQLNGLLHKITKSIDISQFTGETFQFEELFCMLLPETFTWTDSRNDIDPLVIENGKYISGKVINSSVDQGGNLLEHFILHYPDEYLDWLKDLYTLSANIGNYLAVPLNYSKDMSEEQNGFLQLFSSKAKGSLFNYEQLFKNLGYLHFRESVDLSIESYPYTVASVEGFQNGDASIHIESSFFEGLTAEEYFLHTISGMEGLMDRSIKTAVTGHLQRKNIYSFEDMYTKNGTVFGGHDSSKVIQLQYAGYGISPSNICNPLAEFNNLASDLVEGSNQLTNEDISTKFPRLINILLNINLNINQYTEESVLELFSRLNSIVEESSVPDNLLIGFILSQSLGEPISQMTMKTFQQATGSNQLQMGFSIITSLLEFSKIDTSKCETRFMLKDPSLNNTVEFYKRIRPLKYSDVISSVNIIDGSTEIIFSEEIEKSKLKALIKLNPQGFTYHSPTRVSLEGEYLEGVKKLFQTKLVQISKVHEMKIVEHQKGVASIHVQGSNLSHFLSFPEIDTDTIECTSLWDIYTTFGIEGARSAMVYYLTRAFSEQGISVSLNHIELIVDSLTWSSEPTTVTRNGIIKGNSTLTRASFEQTIPILIQSAINNTSDSVSGPTDMFILGQHVKYGTGAFNYSFEEIVDHHA